MNNLTASIVIYNSGLSGIDSLFKRLRADPCVQCWAVVDNGSSGETREAVEASGGIYIRAGENLGFGRGHNLALKRLADVDAPYHLILNPDIALGGDVLGRLAGAMDANPGVGLMMPRVLYPDGSNQYLCKLLPTPMDLVLRRFAPGFIRRAAQKRIASYELREFDYATPAQVPSLSGCFMFTRRAVLDTVGGFDERFFLYMEDLDLCRRMGAVSKLLYWPGATVTHVHQKASYRNVRSLTAHLIAAVKYFNKWGWFFDPQRKEVNRATLADLRARGYKV